MHSPILQRLAADALVGREGIGLSENDEKILLARFVAGDRAAFERLAAMHRPRLTRLAYRLLGWHGDPEDVVHDVFLAAMENGHKFRGQNGLSAWLTAITLNKARSRLRRKFLGIKWLQSRSRDEPADTSADSSSLRDEVGERVRAAVRSLRPRDREVVVLFYLEGRCVRQISELTGDSENAIDVRLHRARAQLRERLAGFMSE